jgi:hypothetical protein
MGGSDRPHGGRRGGKLTANGARIKRTYREDEVDYFFILTGDGSVYLIPLAVTGGARSLVLDSKYAAYRVQRESGAP